ncbi:MAG: glycine cleavage system protein GcvH [Candidatus Ranarchaeia archaeon]
MKIGDYELNEEVYYSKTHEWFKVDGDKVVVGLDDVAQQLMGEITFIEVTGESGAIEVGTTLSAKDKIGEMESHKAVEDVFTHISGKVVAINGELSDFPNKVNEDPYGEGWMLKIEPTNLEEDLKKLMKAEDYAKTLNE